MLGRFFGTLRLMYSWDFPKVVVQKYRDSGNSPGRLLKWFWQTKYIRPDNPTGLSQKDKETASWLQMFMGAVVVASVCAVAYWAWRGAVGLWAFGLAGLVATPFLVVHGLAVSVWLKRVSWYIVRPKKIGRAILARLLERQVRKLRRRHDFKVVAVAGSLGKTSTKLAIANLLKASGLRVRYQEGNYNDRLTVPLVFFGKTEPSLWNIYGWLKLIGDITATKYHTFNYDVVVVELGTDGPGQIAEFSYIRPDIGVLTAIAPEHILQFGSLEAVAAEEMTIFNFSDHMLVNADDVAGKYLTGRTFEEYSTETNVARNYHAKAVSGSLRGQKLQIEFPKGKLTAEIVYAGTQGVKFAVAAAAVADMLGVPHKTIASSLSKIQPFSGRMQVLSGLKNSTLIDDTYNASPASVKAALDVLYKNKAPQRIAILGSMNELGDYTVEAHKEVGDYCDPKKLDFVVTVGEQAKLHMAPRAKKRGCTVFLFKSPYEAGEFVLEKLKKEAIVLAKGSQNGVFTEESIKQLLANPADAKKLVRQSDYWLKIKKKQFGRN